jgi:hypothetical protein
MKTVILILVCLSLMAQTRSSPTPGDSQKVTQADAATIAALQAQIAELTAKQGLDATAKAITTECPSCLSSLARILNGATPGQYTSMVLCCGPATIPPTPPESHVLYILQAACAVAPGTAGVAVSPHD